MMNIGYIGLDGEGGVLARRLLVSRRPPVFSSIGLWSLGVNLAGFESVFGHKQQGSFRPGIS